jgi:hypothetical protein
VSWDIPSGVVHLEVGANGGGRWFSTKQALISDKNAYPDIDGRPVTYDLKKHSMINDDPNWKPGSAKP